MPQSISWSFIEAHDAQTFPITCYHRLVSSVAGLTLRHCGQLRFKERST